MPRLTFGADDRDQHTLRRVADLGLVIAFECRNRRKVSQRDQLELILDAKLGDLRPKGAMLAMRQAAGGCLDALARRQGLARLVASPAEGDKIGT
jgi:hypothetical protein